MSMLITNSVMYYLLLFYYISILRRLGHWTSSPNPPLTVQ